MKHPLFLVLISALGLITANAQTSINLSHDLVRLGIASQNLSPDNRSLDARPLFQAALAYASNHGAQLITVDRGSYYFLTGQDPSAYLRFSAVSDLTVNLADSTIYFADAFRQGFSLTDCQRVTLTNFTIDFLQPPYTYVRLASVNPTQRLLVYSLLPNWVDPVTFNGGVAAGSPLVIWAVAFRNGQIVPGTSRMHVNEPIANNVLQLVQDNTPWTQRETLSTLQPGDTLVVTQRGGPPPVIATQGDSIVIRDLTIYGSSAFGLFLNSVSNSTVYHVYVVPRPGNLLATNADGIHIGDSGPNNHVRNCVVTETLDDAIAIDSLHLATVLNQPSPQQLTVERKAYLHFPNGTAVHFVDPFSTDELPGGTILSQNPPDSNPPEFDGLVTLTFDRTLPTLSPNSQMVFAGPNSRGAGSSIENNIVGEVPFGRGIWIGGSEGVTIEGNWIGHTSNGGIEVFEDTYAPAYPVPPAHNIVIRNNLVYGSLGPMASGSGTQIALGAISVVSTNNTNAFATTQPNSNISIQNNFIFDSGRSGIWVGALNGGTIQDNLIVGYNKYPELPLFGVSPQESLQLLQDFTQPIVVHDSQGVTVQDNLELNN